MEKGKSKEPAKYCIKKLSGTEVLKGYICKIQQELQKKENRK